MSQIASAHAQLRNAPFITENICSGRIEYFINWLYVYVIHSEYRHFLTEKQMFSLYVYEKLNLPYNAPDAYVRNILRIAMSRHYSLPHTQMSLVQFLTS